MALTQTTVPYNQVRSGNLNGAFSTVTSAFTCPIAGAYFVVAPIGFQFGGAVASNIITAINVNGIAVQDTVQSIQFAVVGSILTQSVQSVLSLNVGDQVIITASSSNAAALVNYSTQTLPLAAVTSLTIFSLF